MKCVINDPKTGKSKQLEIEQVDNLVGKKIGDTITLEQAAGYEFVLTGGSNEGGFPMRFDVDQPQKRIMSVSGIGFQKGGKGVRRRRTVAGKSVTEKTAQINLKISKFGKESLFEQAKQEETPQKQDESTDQKPSQPQEGEKA